MTLRFADLYCGAGGAAQGLHKAFPDAEIDGFDIVDQPRYPFRFFKRDALTVDLDGYDFAWASPPCQGYSVMRHLPWNRAREYPLLIEPTRERLRAWGGWYCIENVMGAQRKAGMGANYLCGTMFGKRFYRHRLFETNFLWLMPLHPTHRAIILGSRLIAGRARTVVFSEAEDARGAESWPGRRGRLNGSGLDEARLRPPEQGGLLRQPTVEWGVPRLIEPGPLSAWQTAARADGRSLGVGHTSGAAAAKAEMEVGWMTTKEMCQAIPPVYSRYLAGFIPLPGRRDDADRP